MICGGVDVGDIDPVFCSLSPVHCDFHAKFFFPLEEFFDAT